MEKILNKSKIDRHNCSGIPLYSRIRHASALLGHEIFLAGGQTLNVKKQQEVLRLDCRTLEFSTAPPTCLPFRKDHQLFEIAENCYIWGGESESQACNDFWRFGETSTESFEQFGSVPCARVDYRIVAVGPRHALLYGGYSNGTFLNDWYLFDCYDHSWKACKTVGQAPKQALYRPSFCWGYDKGYLLGGQIASLTSTAQYSNNFYEIKVQSFANAQLRFKKLPIDDDLIARAGHACLLYCNKYLFVIGGETVAEDSTEHQQFAPRILDDFWIFTIQLQQWSKSDVKISQRFGFSAHIYESKIFLLCGARNLQQLCDDMEVIIISDADPANFVCGLCQVTNCFPSKPSYKATYISPKKPQTEISLEFVDGLAQLIKLPFHAIGLLIDNSYNMGANEVRITMRISNNHHFLQIKDNSRPFSHQQFIDTMYKFNIRRSLDLRDRDKEDIILEAEYGLNLKLGSLRLGRCVLFISKNEQQTYIAFMSTLQMYIPHVDHFKFLDYCHKNKQQPLSTEYAFNRSSILQACRHIISMEEFHDMERDYSKVYKKIIIFELRGDAIGTRMNYELELAEEDLLFEKFWKKQHKSEPEISTDIESSLRAYISHMYLVPYMGRPIYLQDKIIQSINYQETIKKLIPIKGLKTYTKEDALQQKCSRLLLVKVPESCSTQQLQGILLYHDNRLFGVYGYELGGVGERNSSLRRAGVIQIPHQIQLNILKTEIEGKFERGFLDNELKKLFVEDRETDLKRERPHIIEDQSRILKKHNRA